MPNPFDTERMRRGLDHVKATVQVRDYGNELALAVSFGDGDRRTRAAWPISWEDADKLYADLLFELEQARRRGAR